MGILNSYKSVGRCTIWLLFNNYFFIIWLFIELLLKLTGLITFRDIFTLHILGFHPNLRDILCRFEITGFEMSWNINALFVLGFLELGRFVVTGFVFGGFVNMFDFDWRHVGFDPVRGDRFRAVAGNRRRKFCFVRRRQSWNSLHLFLSILRVSVREN